MTGRVVDERDQPVPYASVALANGRTGTATNGVGEFGLRVSALPQPLTVLSIGYERAGALATQAGACQPPLCSKPVPCSCPK